MKEAIHAEREGARVVQERAGPAPGAADPLHDSPRMVAQRARIGAAYGPVAQREGGLEDEEPLQARMAGAEAAAPAIAPPNETGMPNQLKAGIEALSGMDMSDVRVHRNSDRPASLQAHAYAQGRDIHLGPGQEKHLPHEAWHVVQQAQGRVRPTTQMARVAVNDEGGLEKEADVMGGRALQGKFQEQALGKIGDPAHGAPVLQGAFWEKVGGDYVWHGGQETPGAGHAWTEETRRGPTKYNKKKFFSVYTKQVVPVEGDAVGEAVDSEEDVAPAEPNRAFSFEASGDGSHALSQVRLLALKMEEGDFYDVQVGFYEKSDALMPGTSANLEKLQALEGRGRLRIRINLGRDATRADSPTRYDQVNIRNIMAGRPDGSSDTSFKSNDALTRGVFGAQSEKLKDDGRLYFAASGRPYFKPGDHRDQFADRVKVDDIAVENGLTAKKDEGFADRQSVKKNQGGRTVGVDGTYTRVYAK